MNKLIHIGFGNIVNAGKIIAIVSPDSAPVKRLVQKAKEAGTAIDATQGRKTKAVLVIDCRLRIFRSRKRDVDETAGAYL